MRAIASLVLAGGIACSAAAQDVIITINPFLGSLGIQYFGALPILQLWSDISIRISGDSPITITNQSSVYTSSLTPTGPVITGNGTNSVTFVGAAGGSLFGGTVDNSNLFSPLAFSYGGSSSAFRFQLFSQNTCTFIQPPFGNPINMMNADGSVGPLSFVVEGPAPGTAALLAIAGVAGARRRR